MNRLALLPLVVLSLLLTACGATGSQEAYNTNMFQAPPVVVNTNGQYSVYVYERTFEPTTIGFLSVVGVGDKIQIYVSGMETLTTQRNGPKIIAITIPPAFQGQDLSHRFVWLNPDNTTNPMQVLNAPPAPPAL